MGHTWKNESHLDKKVTLGEVVGTEKSESHLKKQIILIKGFTLRKRCHTWKNGSHLEKWVTMENG